MTLDEAIRRLRDVNEPVPVPSRLPTPAEVASAETALGVQFPPDYRRFLLEASDVVCGVLEPCTVVPGHGYLDLVAANQMARAAGVPDGLLAFCEDNGDYFCLDSAGGVVYWSHNGSTDERWLDLAAWIAEVWIAGG